ncbi:hypothetical protein A3Q56_05674 [Intoshia linei]|uniref:FAM50A/XAP5 C-terminal domain-containing protein n=1 Tax=Intoshia linei TaxID=1819745 RepID=A0A177AX57_9BILA|nr:hypothetical protein A3Q56_05674 [Intoshia linei]
MTFSNAPSKNARREMKKRQLEKQLNEMEKDKISKKLKVANIQNKFSVSYESVQEKLKCEIIGLLTLDQMKEKQRLIVESRQNDIATLNKKEVENTDKVETKPKIKINKSKLSFELEDEDEENSVEPLSEGKRFGLNPDVNTSYCPDIDKENDDVIKREELCEEWRVLQKITKEEMVYIPFHYWDGCSHSHQLHVPKKINIGEFCLKALELIRDDYNELKKSTVNDLMFIKHNLIIPQHYTIYDFVVAKRKLASGELIFNFIRENRLDYINEMIDLDAEKNKIKNSNPIHDNILSDQKKIKSLYKTNRIDNIIVEDQTDLPSSVFLKRKFPYSLELGENSDENGNDPKIEVETGNITKIVSRTWYDSNKHIYPANQWTPYKPEKN